MLCVHMMNAYLIETSTLGRQNKGFALIATISVMTLLVMVALAMLSLATIETRQNGNTVHEQEARSNARLALMMAIGQLQKHGGADTRVTARADIKESVDPTKSHWTGVWNSGEWNPLEPGKRKFVGWLVSDPDGNLPEDDVLQPLPGDNLVTVLGAGSVMDAGDAVKVRKVSVRKGGAPSGSYAYWVGDEGVKASYLVPRIGKDAWNMAGNLGTAATSGISSFGIPGYDGLAEDRLLASGITRRSMDLPAADSRISRKYFHDVTPQAVTLLTDVRLGGARMDLSTAFELPLEDFNRFEEFHAAGENNGTGFYDEFGSTYKKPRFYHPDHAPDLGYVCEIPWGAYGGIVRGVSWDHVRNHYRLYKKEWEATPWERSVGGVPARGFAARGSLPHSYSGMQRGGPNHPNDVSGDDFAYHISNGSIYSKYTEGSKSFVKYANLPRGAVEKELTVSRSPQLSPIVVRMTVAFGMVRKAIGTSGDWKLALSFDPYLTIMNPYNVPITFDSIGMWCSKFSPVYVEVDYFDNAGVRRRAKFNKYFSRNHYTDGSFTLRLDPTGGSFTLEPGEVRVVSPKKIAGGRQMAFAGISPVRGSFLYGEESGLYMINGWGGDIRPKDGTTVKVRFKGKRHSDAEEFTETERFLVSLYHTKNHAGGSRDIFRNMPPNNMYGDEDILDQPLITNLSYSSYDKPAQPAFAIERAVNTSQIPRPGTSGLYLGVLDLKMKTTAENFPSLTMNPRSGAFDTRDYESSDRSSPQWDVVLERRDDLSQLELVADPTGHGIWGEGRTSATGSTHNVLYEVPQLPLTSLAQLQHVDTGITGTSGSLQIGNSFPHPGIKSLDEIVTQRSKVPGGFAPADSQVLADMAWASNEALWDRYFFSGINWRGTGTPSLGLMQGYSSHEDAVTALINGDRSQPWPLQNPRLDLYTRALSDQQTAELRDYDKLADYLAVFGGFNVNSTSEKAWGAVFSCLRGVDVTYSKRGGGKATTRVENAFSRFMIPANQPGEVFGSFRDLSDDDIKSLAEAMVTQVKARGPFMGLADFVNRRLSKDSEQGTDLGAVGALQSAIEAADLNKGKVQHKPTAGNLENVGYRVDGKNRSISTYAGTSGYLLQADILNSIGGILSARSDTFVIRAYGESLDARGKVRSRAWCEATVQRSPEWLVSTDESATKQRSSYPDSSGSPILRQWEKNPGFPQLNREMGRKITIQSFRWLAEDEV